GPWRSPWLPSVKRPGALRQEKRRQQTKASAQRPRLAAVCSGSPSSHAPCSHADPQPLWQCSRGAHLKTLDARGALLHLPDHLQGLTREGADRVLPAEVEALHEAVLGAAEQHVGFGGVEADFVHRALVLCEQLVLLVARRPSQVPRDHHAVGGRRGQQVLIHLVPDHVGAAQVERGLAAHTQVQLLHKLLVLNGVDLEDAAARHDHLGGVTAHTDGIGRRVQVAVHGAARQRAATQGCGHSGHLLHGCPGGVGTRGPSSGLAWSARRGLSVQTRHPGWVPPNCLILGRSVLGSQSRTVHRPSGDTSDLWVDPTRSVPALVPAPSPNSQTRVVTGPSVSQSLQGCEVVPTVRLRASREEAEGPEGRGGQRRDFKGQAV
uniref:Uncharacterized protein n=1 Tax=Felis catus TaxID=9685 RepID=A0ABI7WL15_FELCA